MSKIKKLVIENSKFYNDPLEINFSSKLNCIMGGLGTESYSEEEIETKANSLFEYIYTFYPREKRIYADVA